MDEWRGAGRRSAQGHRRAGRGVCVRRLRLQHRDGPNPDGLRKFRAVPGGIGRGGGNELYKCRGYRERNRKILRAVGARGNHQSPNKGLTFSETGRVRRVVEEKFDPIKSIADAGDHSINGRDAVDGTGIRQHWEVLETIRALIGVAGIIHSHIVSP